MKTNKGFFIFGSEWQKTKMLMLTLIKMIEKTNKSLKLKRKVVALLEKHCKLDHNIENLNEEEIRQLFLTIRKHKKLVKKWFKEYERFKSFSFY